MSTQQLPPASSECTNLRSTEHGGDKAPPAKRRKVDEDGRPGGSTYENTTAQGSSRNVYGNVYGNLYLSTPEHMPTISGPAQAQFESMTANPTVLDMLAFDEMDDRYDTIQSAHAKTCAWLLEREEYKAWRDPERRHSNHGFLWIKGKPGAGKSTIMKYAHNCGVKTFREDVIISYFFNARGVALQKSTQGIYRSLLHQILERVSRVSSVLPLRKCTRLRDQDWPVESLREIFRCAVLALGSTRLTCYIDALDECEESDARGLIESLETLGASAVEDHIHFHAILSSRHYPNIVIRKCQVLVLEGQEGHDADIEQYIQSKLHVDGVDSAPEIRNQIQQRASGVFLWVVLVLRILNADYAQGNTTKLTERLQAIPDDLNHLFADIIRRGSADQSRLLLIFQWVLYSERPMKREELYHAIVDGLGGDITPSLKPTRANELRMERYLLNSSKGLTEMTKGKSPTVQFIHETARTYLADTGIASLAPAMRSNLPGRCHDQLKQLCRSYLSKAEQKLLLSPSDGFKQEMQLPSKDLHGIRKRAAEACPFLCYALKGMWYHANAAHSAGAMQSAFVRMGPYVSWIRLQNICAKHRTRLLGSKATKEYIFTIQGAHHLLDIAFRTTKPTVNTVLDVEGERHRSLLGAAVDLGDLHAFDTLLGYGASPDSLAKENKSCLIVAIERNDAPMVQALLDAGAQFDLGDIQYASDKGHVAASKVLLARSLSQKASDARIDITSAEIQEALDHHKPTQKPSAAANPTGSTIHFDDFIISLLLDACRDGSARLVNILTRFVQLGPIEIHAALCVAARSIQSNVLQTLTKTVANINELDEDAHTVLMNMAIQRRYDSARLLISNGADIHLTDKKGMTALHHAAENYDNATTSLLLRSGADVNALDHSATTALMHVCSSRVWVHNGDLESVKTVQTLIDAGADLAAIDLEMEDALFKAAQARKEQLVRLFLPNARLGLVRAFVLGLVKAFVLIL